MSSRIATILAERYPCKEAPYGTWAAISREVDVSGERVRQVAIALGWKMVPAPDRRLWYQCACGKIQRSPDLCNECRYVTLPCEGCGGPVRTSARQFASRVSHHPGPVSYRGRVFCGRPCFGRWAGTNRVGRHRPENLERLRTRLEADFPDRGVPWGTWRRLARELGLSESWVARAGSEIGWRIEVRLK